MVESAGEEAAPLRVAFCHLESLICLPAVNRLFAEMGDHIGLVILSNRFGSKHGGLMRQFTTSVRRSGIRLTVWLGFDILAAQIAGRIGEWIGTPNRRRPQLADVRSLANYYNASVLDAADVNGNDVIAALRAYAPDVVVVLNFDQILRPEFIAAAAHRVINVHPSLLPALRGPCPVFWALAEGQLKTGVSLHLIDDETIDAGAVLVQRARPIDQAYSVAEITAALFEEGAALIPDTVRAFQAGHSVKQPQETAKASYRGFPDRAAMAHARRTGVRLCQFRQLAALLARAVGVLR